MDPNKQKALDAALAQIESQFGRGTVMRMGSYLGSYRLCRGFAILLNHFVSDLTTVKPILPHLST